MLAGRVRESGRAQFTRPLSSYHRRIVHMALQGEEDLITRSKGEGALKRVIVALRGGSGGQTRKRGWTAPMDGPDTGTLHGSAGQNRDHEEQNFVTETDSAAHHTDDAASNATLENGTRNSAR
jgi:hypothetical protein